MKKSLFLSFIAAAAVMSGCSNNETFEEVVMGQDQMVFSPVVGKQTRASEVVSADLNKNGTVLKLYNYKTADAFKDRVAPLAAFFNGNPESLTYTGGWKTAAEYTWTDLGQNQLSIFTFHSPKNVLTAITEPTALHPAKFEYTVPSTIATQEDLLVATNLDMTQRTTGGIIAFNFQHALSQLYFKAKLSGTDYRAEIKSIKVLKALSKSTFSYGVEAADGVGSWATPTTEFNYTFAEGIAQKIISNTTADKIGTNGSLMLMPQAANAGKFQFEVVYDVYETSTGTDKLIGANIKKTADMEALAMGKKYAYTLILPASASDNIIFSVSVTNWDESATEREIRFDEHKMSNDGNTDAAAIAGLILNYNPTTIYLQEVKVTGTTLPAALTIDLSTLNKNAVKGSQVIIDCGITDWDSKAITITKPGSGWSASHTDVLDGTSGKTKVVLTKD